MFNKAQEVMRLGKLTVAAKFVDNTRTSYRGRQQALRCMATLDVTVQVLSAQGDDQAMHSMIVNRLENLRPTRLQECLLLS